MKIKALLAVLAAAGRTGATRDAVLAILWTDAAPERARHSLAQALYALRRELDGDVISSGPVLRLDANAITSDIAELREAMSDQRVDDVDALYRGPFLEGFYLADAPEFERWVDTTRTELQRQVVAVFERAAEKLADAPGATAIWERLTKLEPLSGRFAVAFMKARAGAGDRTAALAHGQSHARLVENELGVPADDAVLSLIAELRSALAKPPPSPPPATPKLARARESTAVSSPWRRSTPLRLLGDDPAMSAKATPRWQRAALIALVLVIVGILGVAVWRRVGRASTAGSATALAARLYDSGLRAFYQGEVAAAARLFDAALAEDSSYAPAAYFAWRSELALGGPRADTLATIALARSKHAGERDARLVAAHVGLTRYDLGAAALADSLARKYPDDPEMLMRAAEATGDLARAVMVLEHALRIDSADAASPTGICRACETLRLLETRYAWADSSAAVLRTLDRWSAIRPFDYSPWLARHEYLLKLDRTDDASAARRRADSLGAPHGLGGADDVELQLRAGAFDAADSLCRAPAALPNDSSRMQGRLRVMCVLALRAQGRQRAALALARDARPVATADSQPLGADADLDAALDLEMGRPHLAAEAQVRAAAGLLAADTTGRRGSAHAAVWHLAVAATALASTGDTIRVRSLIDSVELIGHRSADPRDPLLHHYLRGLLLASAGDLESAVREYRLASSMPAHDFSRIQYEMARSRMALHRPLDAAGALRAILHGDIDGAGLTLSPTEARLRLAEALELAGERDSANVHFAVVERAWRHADPSFASRYQSVREALLRTGRMSR
jgi:DNA-binding SARP family transcriptional activator/tetratricopeptide (TPR) repeat protein